MSMWQTVKNDALLPRGGAPLPPENVLGGNRFFEALMQCREPKVALATADASLKADAVLEKAKVKK